MEASRRRVDMDACNPRALETSYRRADVEVWDSGGLEAR